MLLPEGDPVLEIVEDAVGRCDDDAVRACDGVNVMEQEGEGVPVPEGLKDRDCDCVVLELRVPVAD